MASPAAKPSMLAPMPKSAPIDEMASERWCHASAIKALEFSTRAQWRVYQNMPSLTTMDKMAAASATIVGALAEAYDRVAMVSMLEYPMARPVPAKIRPSMSDATHSKRSWP